MTNITVWLPEDLARYAQSAGLLREAMQRQVDRLFDAMGKLAQLEPALTETETEAEAEIDAARARRR